MEKGIVFSIEEFAIHDGPGIRTTVFLKGCPLRCAWCHNPEGISPEPQYMDRRDGRTMCGYAICSGELAGKLLRNKAVYAMNRGGVTLTGGEPLLQAAFAAEVLAALQAAGVHTAVETSGYAAPDVFRRVAGHADLVLFDVKHADPVQHRRWTGVDNAPILLGAGLNSSNDLIYRVVTFLYRRIGNEKVTVNFQLITLKFPVSNNLCKNTHNFRKNQILLSSTVHPCYSSNYESGIISISVRPLARSVVSRPEIVP